MKSIHMTSRLTQTGLALALWVLLSPPLHAMQTLTITSLLGADKPETQVWIEFSQRLEQRLPGEFRLRVITDAALVVSAKWPKECGWVRSTAA